MAISGGIAAAAVGGAVSSAVGGAMSGGGGGGGGTVTQQTQIPDVLLPLVNSQTQLGVQALANLKSLLNRSPVAQQLVTPFNQNQLAAQQQAIDIAGGAGGFIPAAQQGLLATAQGDFMFGNPAFDEAVQASIRAAQPSILSTFGSAGGTPGGLAATAIQQAASDSFAGLFNEERARQQQAQLALPSIALTPSSILESIGGQQQTQAQRELLAPLEAQNILLNASNAGSLNLSGLLGQTQQSSQQGIGALSAGLLGALGGAQIGTGLTSALSGLGGGTAQEAWNAGNFGAFSPNVGF